MLELQFTQTLGNHTLTINETLPASGITAIFGVSGAGKTSLINAISGLTRTASLDGRACARLPDGSGVGQATEAPQRSSSRSWCRRCCWSPG